MLSVVTPVYNGEAFIHGAYNCLCRQSCGQWEWVVVDDGSTDGTLPMLTALARRDPRVRVFTQQASGSAKQPRDHAVSEARAPFVLAFDVDDRLSPDYLELLMTRQQQTGADIVYATMLFTDAATGHVTRTLPTADIDTARLYTGRELVSATLPEWRIGCNGGLYRREVWVNMSWPAHEEPLWMNSDEVDERLYLLQARRVAFCPAATYHYLNHAASITQRVTPKLFHTLKTSLQLVQIVDDAFGPTSEEHRLATLHAFYDWRSKMRLYAERTPELGSADATIHQSLRHTMTHIDTAALSPRERRRFMGLRPFPLLLALFALRYRPRLIIEKALQRMAPHFYLSHTLRRRTEADISRRIAPSYSNAPQRPFLPCAVSMHCHEGVGGGLADRLRGAVSLFEVCQATGTPFRLHFTHPFPLTDYLEPAAYDWRIPQEELTFNKEQAQVVVIDTQPDTPAVRRRQRRQIAQALSHGKEQQVHVYTNAPFSYDADFAALWAQLFRPTPRLEHSISREQERIGGAYTAVSARFCNLLDDFNEEVYTEPLSAADRERLIKACLHQMELLHSQVPERRLVLCTDSSTFARRAAEALPCVYSAEGTISHIGNDRASGYAHYEKTFLDFFIISRAHSIVRLLGPGMMASGFPYAAALASGHTCQDITFNAA